MLEDRLGLSVGKGSKAEDQTVDGQGRTSDRTGDMEEGRVWVKSAITPYTHTNTPRARPWQPGHVQPNS